MLQWIISPRSYSSDRGNNSSSPSALLREDSERMSFDSRNESL